MLLDWFWEVIETKDVLCPRLVYYFMCLSDLTNQYKCKMEMGKEVWQGQSAQLLTFQLEQHMVGMASEQTQ